MAILAYCHTAYFFMGIVIVTTYWGGVMVRVIPPQQIEGILKKEDDNWIKDEVQQDFTHTG